VNFALKFSLPSSGGKERDMFETTARSDNQMNKCMEGLGSDIVAMRDKTFKNLIVLIPKKMKG